MTQNPNQNPDDGELSPGMARAARFLGKLIPKGLKADIQDALDHYQQTGEMPADRIVRERKQAAEGTGHTAKPNSVPKAEETRPDSKKRYELAVLAQTMWDTAYKPEATLQRETQKLRSAGASGSKISSFVDFYVGEANDILHAETRPVIVAEEMRATFKGHGEQCSHCNQTFYGASSKIVGAKNPKDLTITADRFRGMADESTVKIAEDAAPEDVLVVKFTDMDRHMLADHHQTDDSMQVVEKLFQLQPFMPVGSVELEQPRYMTPDQRLGRDIT